MAHRILIASYHFPPDAAVGGLRIAKFTRHLSELGWQPHVLTVQDGLRESGEDPDRLRGLEHVPIVKTGELPRVVEALTKALSRHRRPDGSQSAAPAAAGIPVVSREGLKARLTRYFVSLLALFPDEKKNWSLRAALVAPGMIRKHHIGWILTSGPPFSVHVIGVVARMLTGVRWIADFRDPWVDMLPHRFSHQRSSLSDSLERRMEALVVRLADRVVTTTDRMRTAMMARYPSASPDKFVCIPNSIDTDGIRASCDVEAFDKLTITYAGTLYFDRTPEPVFHAVAQLIASGRGSANDIRIVLLGDCRKINGVPTENVVREYGLDSVVEVIDRVPYPQAVEMMRKSHLLLVLAPSRHELVVPAKIYDYLGTGAVVLTLAEPGATADLMDETQCGRCFSHTDISGIRDYIAGLLEGSRYRSLRNRPEMFTRYDARELTARLVSEITRVEADTRGEVVVGA